MKLYYLGRGFFGSKCFLELRHLYVDKISDITDVSSVWPT